MTYNTQISTEDSLILHSFDTLFKVRECMRTIEQEQNIELDVSTTYASGKSIAIIEIRGMTKDYSGWSYEINVSQKNSKYAEFTSVSKKCALWIYENFNIKQQKNGEFNIEEIDNQFFWQFLLKKYAEGTDKKSPAENLMICLNRIEQNLKDRDGFNKPGLEACIKRYAVLKEKELLSSHISVSNHSKQPNIHKI